MCVCACMCVCAQSTRVCMRLYGYMGVCTKISMIVHECI